ncbi:MAG: sugar phosphate isomerase/epimerase [Sedimentisphaerales bacterium]|nr:sugar phosphate isomerase/epimerase [Sedimentisphaerales bacterium]
MKLAYHGATSMKSSLETDVQVSAKAGFTALELWAAKVDTYLAHNSIDRLKKLFTDNGIEPTAINSIEFIGFRGKDYKKIQKRCLQLCQIAKEINCSTIVVVPSPTPQAKGGSVLELFFPWQKVVDEYVAVLRDLSDIAKPYNVNLAFEFVGFPWCSVRTPRGAFEIVKKVNRKNIGMNLDCCHFYIGGGDISEIDKLDTSKILTFHLNDLEDAAKEALTDGLRVLPGLGVINLDEICKKVKHIGYDGVCAIELFREEYWHWEPQRLASKAYATAKKILEPHFTIE